MTSESKAQESVSEKAIPISLGPTGSGTAYILDAHHTQEEEDHSLAYRVEQRVLLGQGSVGRDHQRRTMYVVLYTVFNYLQLQCIAFVYSIETFPVIRIPAGSSTSS